MSEKRVPDPTLMARLQLSAKGVDWAAALVRNRQHEQHAGAWSAHQHLAHLLMTECEVYQPRLQRLLAEKRPVLAWWDEDARMRDARFGTDNIDTLAERFMAEREKTVQVLKSLTPEQWARTGIWPDGREIDIAWFAEKALSHGLEHFVALLQIHEELEPLHAPAWLA
jgi:hypothetical protein